MNRKSSNGVLKSAKGNDFSQNSPFSNQYLQLGLNKKLKQEKLITQKVETKMFLFIFV